MSLSFFLHSFYLYNLPIWVTCSYLQICKSSLFLKLASFLFNSWKEQGSVKNCFVHPRERQFITMHKMYRHWIEHNDCYFSHVIFIFFSKESSKLSGNVLWETENVLTFSSWNTPLDLNKRKIGYTNTNWLHQCWVNRDWIHMLSHPLVFITLHCTSIHKILIQSTYKECISYVK